MKGFLYKDFYNSKVSIVTISILQAIISILLIWVSFASKGEMRKLTQGGGVSINKEKLAAFDQMITTADLLDDKYILVQQGKKKYFLIIIK